MIEIEVYRTVPEYIEEDFNNILYVDDEESNLRVFDSVFSRYYNVYTANNGTTAIEMLHEFDIHMIITDQKMPEMTGTDLLEQTLEDFPDIIRIILTGFADIQAIIKAINKCSIYKYITKPYENAEIKEIIDKGLEIYNMRQKKYQQEQEQAAAIVNGHEKPAVMSKASASGVALPLLNDLKLTDEEFESYFDFHIDYSLLDEETIPHLYGDFVINADEEGTSLFFLTMKATNNDAGAISFMHIKSKFRTLVEGAGNDVDLGELKDSLLAVYKENELDTPQDLKILTYHWETNAVSYLSQDQNVKLYAIGDQLEPVKFKKKAVGEDYHLFSAVVENDLMLYFWDFALSSEAAPEAPDYFKQIINHAISVPFDLQEGQISSGIKSVSKHFDDALLYGLYIND